MAKRLKSKRVSVLTKIDPASLRSKPQAVSQHAAKDGKPVTTAVNPVYEHPFDESDIFNANPLDFKDEDLGETDEEDAVRGYYVSRVCPFLFPSTH